MNQKKKICKTCGKEEYIFSKGNCKVCASKVYANKASEKPKKLYRIPKTTEKNKAKRKDERAGYGDFFAKHISIIINERRVCQECGARLQGLTGEVAHILSKSKSPEVATLDENVLYLCFYGESCHADFDSNLYNRQAMNVFPLAAERYNSFKHLVTSTSSEINLFENHDKKGTLLEAIKKFKGEN